MDDERDDGGQFDDLAWDELDAMGDAVTAEDCELFYERVTARRADLDPISARRYDAMMGDPEAIQRLFDFLGRPLVPPEDGTDGKE